MGTVFYFSDGSSFDSPKDDNNLDTSLASVHAGEIYNNSAPGIIKPVPHDAENISYFALLASLG